MSPFRFSLHIEQTAFTLPPSNLIMVKYFPSRSFGIFIRFGAEDKIKKKAIEQIN